MLDMMDEVNLKFKKVYDKFKLHFYQKIFERIDSKDDSLTTVETFCMETIYAMGSPTVNEFAKFLGLSTPNAAYKVNNLVKKGYLERTQSKEDKREYHLQATQKYIDLYDVSNGYQNQIIERAAKRFTPEELSKFEEILTIMANELMIESSAKG